MSSRLPPLLPPSSSRPQNSTLPAARSGMAATHLPPLGPHGFLPLELSHSHQPRTVEHFPYNGPAIAPLHHGYARNSATAQIPSLATQKNEALTPQSSQSRRPGVAPLARLLHSEPWSPIYSKSPISPKDHLQISPQTKLGPELPPLKSSLDHSPIHPPRQEYPGGSLARYSSRDEQKSYTSSPIPAHSASHPSPTNSYESGLSSTPHGRPAENTKPPKSHIENPTLSANSQSRYRLSIRQQPIAARACGHGERDRRVIDPPPILQLSLADFDPDSSSDVAQLKWPFNVVLCSLYSVPPRSSAADRGHEVTTIPDPNNVGKETRRLMGTLVANPFVGIDPEAPPSKKENARLGCFFIFHDLSCRQSGLYRLRFSLTSINIDSVPTGSTTSVLTNVDSEVFEVFSAKDFPGMRASTTLTKELKRQGATVAVKKGNEGKGTRKGKKRGSTDSEASASEGSDNGGSNSKSSKGKKRKP